MVAVANPAAIARAVEEGLAHHRAGQLAEAEAVYRRVLEAQPDHPDALRLLGLIANQTGHHEAAVGLISKAVAHSPQTAVFHGNLGAALKALGKFDEAVAACRQAVELDPGFVDAHNDLGISLRALGRHEEALAAFRRAVEVDPRFFPARNNVGLCLLEMECLDEAGACFQTVLELEPGYAVAHSNLGNVFVRLGNLDEAIAAYRRAIELKPDFPEAHNNLGGVLHEQGRFDEAVLEFERAIALQPDYVEAFCNLGNALEQLGRTADAMKAYRRTIEIKPDFAKGHVHISFAHGRQGFLAAAEAAAQEALRHDPENGPAIVQHLTMASRLGMLDTRERLRATLDAKLPGILSRSREDMHVLKNLAYLIPYLGFEDQVHLDVMRTLSERLSERRVLPPIQPPRRGDSTLRIGYVSADFGDHPVGHLVAPLFQMHDRTRFRVHCYAIKQRDHEAAPYAARIRDGADVFTPLAGVPAVAAAQRIRDDGIDILLDLTGYLSGGRPEILAERPARLQAHWLMHHAGMPAPFIDYTITDKTVMPDSHVSDASGALVRMPHCFQIVDRQPVADAPMRRTEFDLPDEAMVLCAFGNVLKLDQSTFAVWMRILDKVPHAVLWLSATPDQQNVAPLREAARRHGVAPERLVFAERLPNKEKHLARHRLADLFLDTIAFGASTTACDALWAGLPVLTLKGTTVSSRIGASMLTVAGLPELICRTAEEYEQRVVEFANDRPALARLSEKLAKNRLGTPLFDPELYVRHLEAAYEEMWRRYGAGEAPKGFDVAPWNATAS